MSKAIVQFYYSFGFGIFLRVNILLNFQHHSTNNLGVRAFKTLWRKSITHNLVCGKTPTSPGLLTTFNAVWLVKEATYTYKFITVFFTMAATLVGPWSWRHPLRRGWHLTEMTRTKTSAMFCNYSRAVWKYIRHLDSCDISGNRDSSGSRQEQTCLQDFATVCISNRQYLGFGRS